MAQIFSGRMAANAPIAETTENSTEDSNPDEFVVFLIGMRINKLWKVHKWLPVGLAMPKMLNELYANPELGLLSHESWSGRTSIMVQYWKSFEHLENYAKSKTGKHLPAWAEFNKKIGKNGDVGVWHETYVCKKGTYENLYVNMPKFGFGKAGEHYSISNVGGNTKNSAKDRLKNS